MGGGVFTGGDWREANFSLSSAVLSFQEAALEKRFGPLAFEL